MESLKEEKMYVKFSNNVEVEQRGSYLDVRKETNWWGLSFEYGCATFGKQGMGKECSLTGLWPVTGESELNGSNLVQETTNKIVVIQESLREQANSPKELAWKKDKLEQSYVDHLRSLDGLGHISGLRIFLSYEAE
ncbi:hypothetical protein Tco_1303509 [Tanacetum coccineum]